MTTLSTEVVAERGRGEDRAVNVNKVEGKDLAIPCSLQENRDKGEKKKENFEWT